MTRHATTCLRPGCHNLLRHGPSGQPRKWCSASCRKVALYSGTCVVCGAPTTYSGHARPSERCHPCAMDLTSWNKPKIVAAIQQWADEHGGIPPVATDWNATLARERGRQPRAQNFPSVNAVQRTFGSWSAGLRAAGFEPYRRNHYGRDGEDPAIIEETVRLHRTGMSMAAIGRQMGVSGPAIARRLDKASEARAA